MDKQPRERLPGTAHQIARVVVNEDFDTDEPKLVTVTRPTHARSMASDASATLSSRRDRVERSPPIVDLLLPSQLVELVAAVVLAVALVGFIGPTVYYRTARALRPKRHTRPSTKRYSIRVGANAVEARKVVTSAIRGLDGARILRSADPEVICAVTELTIITHGELVTAWITEGVSATTIEVESTACVMYAFIDWGRNARNIEQVLDAVATALPKPHTSGSPSI